MNMHLVVKSKSELITGILDAMLRNGLERVQIHLFNEPLDLILGLEGVIRHRII